MKDGVKELAAIVVDWCEADLMGDGFAGAGADAVAREAIRCMLFTLTHDPIARTLFEDLLRQERAEWIASHSA